MFYDKVSSSMYFPVSYVEANNTGLSFSSIKFLIIWRIESVDKTYVMPKRDAIKDEIEL